jgi:hypothetical protein
MKKFLVMLIVLSTSQVVAKPELPPGGRWVKSCGECRSDETCTPHTRVRAAYCQPRPR